MLRVIVTALTVAHASDGLPVKAPTSVGMSESRLETIDRVVTRGISAGGYPGAAVVVGRKGAAVWQKGFGHLSWGPDAAAVVTNKTIYDIASLSKVVGTTSAIMLLYDEKRIDLDAPVFRYLPGFSGGNKDKVTVRQLLTHRSGLPAGRDIWRVARTPEQARDMVLSTPLEYMPDTRYIYSDLGADLLGFIVETVSGERMDRFLDHRLFQPLGMTDTYYQPADSLRYRIAPTELNPPRGYPLRGEVHDENAYALGGVAGHAGLFSTAADLSIFAQMMLNKGEYQGKHIFSDSTVDLFTRRMTGHRALGWDTADGDFGSGQYLTEKSYGHTGFTGTSLWIDPDREMFVILLTNRVHAATAYRPAKVISDVRSDLSDAAVLAVMDSPAGITEMPAFFRADRAVGWNVPLRPVRAKSRLASRGTVVRNSRVKKGKSSKASASKASVSKSKGAKSKVVKSKSAKSKIGKATRNASSKKSVKSSTAKKQPISAKKKKSQK